MYTETTLTPEDIATRSGALLLEFGASWCPICQGAQPIIEEALAHSRPIHRLMIEDGPGRKLGRSFRVKLWPTLIFLKNGQEVARVVRPADAAAIADGLTQITN